MGAQDSWAATGPSGSPHGGEVAAQHLLTVRSCSRIGRRANPPGFSLAGWLRSGRRA
ncbi:hypothetical protein JRC04_11520 [Mycolicibacterium sp. S2-37]|uniref:hypothetical protein n=1 Tax=Mycolicibacterium sp. S2-37 TaxID=2810297 RepID=UPI001A94DB9F|nr:hypothetical protein [Mycolicibacterium sp. S2-37]MBO0678095.1 hypothetical protein [Mycolicibacterium sp. S2-37]